MFVFRPIAFFRSFRYARKRKERFVYILSKSFMGFSFYGKNTYSIFANLCKSSCNIATLCLLVSYLEIEQNLNERQNFMQNMRRLTVFMGGWCLLSNNTPLLHCFYFLNWFSASYNKVKMLWLNYWMNWNWYYSQYWLEPEGTRGIKVIACIATKLRMPVNIKFILHKLIFHSQCILLLSVSQQLLTWHSLSPLSPTFPWFSFISGSDHDVRYTSCWSSSQPGSVNSHR